MKDQLKRLIVKEFGDFYRAESGNRVTPYNTEGLGARILGHIDKEPWPKGVGNGSESENNENKKEGQSYPDAGSYQA